MLIDRVRKKGPMAVLAGALGAVSSIVAACGTSAPSQGSLTPPATAVEERRLSVGETVTSRLGSGALLFIDDVRVPDADARSTFAALDRDDIESIEVIRGAAATRLYGDEAPEGAILIRMKER
jgi:outer membrane receptor protein involved in Fe transport